MSEGEEPAWIRAKVKRGREPKSPIDRIDEAGGIDLETARRTGIPMGKSKRLDDEEDD